MTRRRFGYRAMLAAAAALVMLPLMLGPGCPPIGPGPTPLAVSAGSDFSIELGQAIVLQGSASGGTQPRTFSWSPPAGLNNATLLRPVFTPTAGGVFTFTLTVTDGRGVQASDTVRITVTVDGEVPPTDGPLTANAGNNVTVSVGSPVTLQGSASGGAGSFQFSWSPSAVLTNANTANPTFTPTAPGVTTFTLTVTDAAGATATDTVIVTASEVAALTSLTWGADFAEGGYQVVAVFSHALNLTSAQNRSNYRITGTTTIPSSASVSGDGRTLTLVYMAPLARTSSLDFSVNNGLMDASGNSVAAFSAVPQANVEDADAPEVVTNGVVWAADFDEGGYQLTATFDEALDAATASLLGAYRINGTTTIASSASVSNDGRTVTLRFEGIALATTDRLDVSVGNLIEDINGNPMALEASVQIRSNPADTKVPAVVVVTALGPTEDGYEVSVEFDEAMSRTGAQTATAYRSKGSIAVHPETATLGGDGRTVVLAFATSLAPTDFIQVGLGEHIRDINGRALGIVGEFKMVAASGDVTHPNAPVLTWLIGEESNGYEFTAVFNKDMDEVSVETLANWRISGTTINPTAVSLAEDLRTATVTFGTAVMRRTERVVVSVENRIRDVGGAPLAQMTLPIAANPSDVISPTVPSATAPMWTADHGSAAGQTGYQLFLSFDETMDLASATNVANYTIVRYDNDENTVLETVGQATSALLATDGRFLTLTFANLPKGLRSSPADEVRDRLRIASAVRDINGRGTISVTPIAISRNTADQAVPTVTSIKWNTLNNTRPYQVIVRFSEAMDATTATDPANYWMNRADLPGTPILPDGFDDPDVPFAPKLGGDGKVLTLTFSLDENALFDPATDTLTIVGGVIEDINGSVLAGLAEEAVETDDGPTGDQVAPQLVSAVWDAGEPLDPMDPDSPPDGIVTQYKLLATFSEALDREESGLNLLFWMQDPAPFGTFAPGVLQPGGHTVEVTFSGIGGPHRRLATLWAINAMDMHGNEEEESFVAVSPNPLDSRRPMVSAVTWVDEFAGPGYRVIVTFDEAMDLVTARSTTRYRISDTVTTPEHFPTLALLSADGMEVALTFTLPLSHSDALIIGLQDSIKDLNNNAVEQVTMPIAPSGANTEPQLVAIVNNGDGTVTIEFSEVLDVDSVISADITIEPVDPPDPDFPDINRVGAPGLGVDRRTVTVAFTQDPAGRDMIIPDTIRDIDGTSFAGATEVVPAP